MSQTTEVGECSLLHTYCTALTACLLLWGQMQREGDILQETGGLQEEFEKASGRVFEIPRDCARKHRDGYRTRTPF